MCDHTGLNNTAPRDRETINNILLALKKFELIDYVEEYERVGNITRPRKRLIMFTDTIKE